jgi:hypothetical protein
MRYATILAALLLWLPASMDAQAKKSASEFERFDVSGLPATPSTDVERQIFLLLRVHRKGDLADATRIHMMLAQYYKDMGDNARADGCSRTAAAAWNAKSDAPETAKSAGKPPFSPERTLRRSFTYTDELNVEHTWEFFVDGTYSHVLSSASGNGAGPTESGWYTRTSAQMRLWQLRPSVDRTVSFELLGPDGVDGAILDGVRMKPGF